MEEAMNLNGMGQQDSLAANSNANSVVEINEGGAVTEETINQNVNVVESPVVTQQPQTLDENVSVVEVTVDSVPNETELSSDIAGNEAITVEIPTGDPVAESVQTEKITIDGPLGPTEVDPIDLGLQVNQELSQNPVNEVQVETASSEVAPVEVPVEAPVEAVSPEVVQVEVPNEELNEELSEVTAMGKELFENASSTIKKSENLFSNMDFGPLKKYIDEDDITDISYSNGGQLWLKSLSRGVYRADEQNINDALVEKIAFQCSNVMGKTFNMAHPFLDSESSELRMNFVHDSIARNGIAAVFRKTPARIRLEKAKILEEKYITLSIHDFLIKAVQGHCNVIVAGETGSGKTELVKYLASHTAYNEKLITIEDTLELHLDRIFPERDIVAMKTNNIASYSDVLVTCMRQNPKWILLAEVRSAEAVTAVRNSISSGHNILSTIHADKAENIPERMYSLLESSQDIEQFLTMMHRYVHLGVYVRGRFDSEEDRFVREIAEVTEFYVNENNEAISNTIYKKSIAGLETYSNISDHLLEYLEGQAVDISELKNFAPSNNSGTGEELQDIVVQNPQSSAFSQVAVDKIV